MLSPAAAAVAPDSVLLRELLAVSLTGIILYTPVYDPAGSGEIVDFTFEYLNPVAQRMMAMPEVPTVTHNQQWPHSIAHGTFAFHVDAFVSGEPREYNINYQADGYDNYYRLAARRAGDGLLVSFTDTADQPRSPVEEALRAAQAAEKAARADAEEQRAALGRAFEQAPVSIAILRGPEFVVELANPSLGVLWGRPVGPALGRPLFEALPDLAGQGLEELLTQVLRTGEPLLFQERPTRLARHPGGPPTLGYYNFTYQPLHDAQGLVTGLITVGLDVTEQVVARQQVQQLNQELEARVQVRTREALALQADLLAAAQRQVQEREQFYQIFAQTPAAICVQRGPKHRYEYVNQAYQDFFPGRQLLGRPVAEALPETVGSGVVDLLDQVYRTGETYYGYELPLLITQPEGPPKQMYFTFTYQAYRENGEIVGISTFAYDVAEQVLARQRLEAYAAELQESEARFRTMADAAPNMVWAVHPNSSIRYINRAFLDFVGLRTEQEYITTGWGPYLHPEELELTQGTLTQAIAQRQPYILEHRLLRHDGQYRWLLAQGAPSYLAGGELYGYVGSAIDITDLKQANEQLQRTNVDLDNFIYTASHDLKQPIANIEGLLQGVQHALPPAGRVGEVPRMLDLMQGAVERFGRTIAHLTDISRLQHEYNQPATAVLLARVVQEVQLDLAPLITQTQARVAVTVPADATLHFSEKNLRSVVYNLLSNALMYRHPDRAPAVSVAYEAQPAHHVLAVRDNGLGLDLARDQDMLFGMFKRLHPHVEGSGIGLYMVKKVVENAGGRIEVESTLGQGSVFRVYVPR
ncbi:PAS domain-containing protein [Hymenobacter sp. B1770]|uniref:PAS domain-containing protein n=1 Tax=Hymenobacter sp. B1770 TaxID=1718788 RepID=UPI003CE6AC42